MLPEIEEKDFLTSPIIEFEVLKEPWNEYEIKDGTITVTIRGKMIVTKILRTNKYDERGDPLYITGSQSIFATFAPPNLRGKPHQRYDDKIRREHEKEELVFTTIKEDWSEYHLKDGSILRTKLILSGINRTDLYHADGDPVYSIYSSTTGRYIVPTTLKKI